MRQRLTRNKGCSSTLPNILIFRVLH